MKKRKKKIDVKNKLLKTEISKFIIKLVKYSKSEPKSIETLTKIPDLHFKIPNYVMRDAQYIGR